jgi:hypothetical protein
VPLPQDGIGKGKIGLFVEWFPVFDDLARWGGDPYLAGEATYEAVVGVQSKGVQATVKHLLLK